MTRSILIVDEMATNRIMLKARLGVAFHPVIAAASADDGLALVRVHRPDLVIIGHMADEGAGPALCRHLGREGAMAGAPVIMLAEPGAATIAAWQAGADAVLAPPVDHRILQARIGNLLRRRDELAALLRGAGDPGSFALAEDEGGFAHRGRVALIARQPEVARHWQVALGSRLPAAVTIHHPQAAPDGALMPDLLLVIVDEDDRRAGLSVLNDLRNRMGGHDAAICLVAAAADADLVVQALGMGVDDILPAGISTAEGVLRIRRLLARQQRRDRQRRRVAEGLRLSMVDALTGLHNRRYAGPALARLLAGGGGVVMLLDIDRFKVVNDRHGHAAGDAVLVAVADRLRAILGPASLLARHGGEEFLIALPAMAPILAMALADRLRGAIADRPITIPARRQGLAITVSIGVAVADDTAATPDQVIDRADQALLLAKMTGRNRVCGPDDGPRPALAPPQPTRGDLLSRPASA